jgi:hypothetical protein
LSSQIIEVFGNKPKGQEKNPPPKKVTLVPAPQRMILIPARKRVTLKLSDENER